MEKSNRRITRTSVKLNMVAEEIRRQIVQGEVGPGDCLPTRTELQDHFGVSRVTVQRALDRLMEDGFIVATPGMGTFVTEHPPHLFRYALVFPYRKSKMHPWPPLWDALEEAAVTVCEDTPYSMAVYYADRGRADSRDYAELEKDVLAHTMGGLIFVASPAALEGLPPLNEPGIPRLAIHEGDVPAEVQMRIRLDAKSFVDKALQHLKNSGRQRIAMITDASMPVTSPFCSYFLSECKRLGMEAKPHWVQAVRSNDAPWAQNVASLYMELGAESRPDGVIIARQALVEYAQAGLLGTGARPGLDIEIVAHQNLPVTKPSIHPMMRIGHDVREVLNCCMKSIQACKSGSDLAESASIASRYEEEQSQAQSWGE